MSRPPAPARLERLAALAALKRDAELARLARVGQTRQRLLDSLATLATPAPPLDPAETAHDPALVAVRLAHRRWTEGRIQRLNQQLAQVSADWERQKPAAARAFGRASVLETLTRQAMMARKP